MQLQLPRTYRTVIACTAAVAAVGTLMAITPATTEAAPAKKRNLYKSAIPGPRTLPTSSISEWPASITIGTTVRGRHIIATRQGNPKAQKILLAIGVIHGNEPKGALIVDRLRQTPITSAANYQLWTIRTMNPDGLAARIRHNARGVDLNRNFPYNWSRWTYAAGRGPGSEAETRAVANFMEVLRPDASLIFHQDWNQVLGVCNSKTRRYAIRFSQLSRIPREPCWRAYTGTAGSWYNIDHPGYALTVELPPSRRITSARIGKFRNAVIRTARELRNLDTTTVLPLPTPEPPEEEETL